ncbi:MAG: DUF1844 domain-containing protein [Candidatus Hydrogenedentes bacterium]|nr:DUF1844 domain-containing protein [Candidatus Hydrogenedentota bacterium]
MADDESKKISIDEDWKAQVQREKEQARVEKADPPKPAAEAAVFKAPEAAPQAAVPEFAPEAALDVPGDDDASEAEEGATFLALVQSLATQTLFALGLIVPDGQKQVMVDLDSARWTIDILAMLHEKTKGNLEPREESELRGVLAELQQAFIARSQQVQAQTLHQAGINPADLKKKQ